MNDLPVQDYDFRVDRPAALLRHRVTETIRNAIAVGRLKAGERVRERDLCEMAGVSRTLVREALRQLESEGVIQVVAHRGPIVAEISPEQAVGIYQVRELLEGLAAELFGTRASDADRAALQHAYEEVEAAFATSDIVLWLATKNRFYDCLFEGAKNEALAASLSMLNARMTLLRARSLQTAARREKSLRELRELIDSLNRGDGVAARAIAVDHVRQAAAAAMHSLETETARLQLVGQR